MDPRDAIPRPRARRLLARRLTFTALFVFLLISIAELLVRHRFPQDLSGNWIELTNRGILVNKSTGRVRHEVHDRIAEYRFSSPHLRGGPVRQGPIRILVLGDSFTFGWAVEEKDTFVSHLQRMADRRWGSNTFQFLNAAVAGWGVADYAAYFEDFGQELSPTAVIVFVHIDDVPGSAGPSLYRIDESEQLVRSDRAVRRTTQVVKQLIAYQWLLEHSHLFQLTKRCLAALLPINEPVRQAPGPSSAQTIRDVHLVRVLFNHLAAMCRERDTKLIVLTTGWGRAHRPDPSTGIFLRDAPAFFHDIDVPFSDLSDRPEFQDTRPFVIPGDTHPNERGHELIAVSAWEELLSSELADICARLADCRPAPSRTSRQQSAE